MRFVTLEASSFSGPPKLTTEKEDGHKKKPVRRSLTCISMSHLEFCGGCHPESPLSTVSISSVGRSVSQGLMASIPKINSQHAGTSCSLMAKAISSLLRQTRDPGILYGSPWRTTERGSQGTSDKRMTAPEFQSPQAQRGCRAILYG